MSLTGTIPVTFSGKHLFAPLCQETLGVMFVADVQGNLYNIPVCVWIKERYPQAAPICYVKPTPEMMMVRRGFLSGDGQVILPYLKEWKKVSLSRSFEEAPQTGLQGDCISFRATVTSSASCR